MRRLLARHLFDFEHPEARRNALLALVAGALISPDIAMPAGLPALRLEQALLGLLIPSLVLFGWRHPEYRRRQAVDVAFLALGLAMTVSIILAPVFVDTVSWSVRDPFELARLVEYWLMFRLGLTVIPERQTARALVRLFCVGAIAMAVFSLLQYLHPGNFNSVVTDVWTVPHNLEGVELTGRVVGTVGNANYYGIMSGLFLALALSVMVLREGGEGGWRRLAPVAVAAATLSVVMSQSRTAVFALGAALALALVYVLVRRGFRAAYLPAIATLVLSAAVSVAFVEVVPPRFESFHQRFSPAGLSSDSSLTTRLSRWRALFAGFFEEEPSFCQGRGLDEGPRERGHDPRGRTGAPEASKEALDRDAVRKQDIARLSRGVLDYFCKNDRWPAGEPLEAALVPGFLPSVPKDPVSGEHYQTYVQRSGFLVGAKLENEADPEGPVYTLGTIPNMVLNASFESGGSGPNSWATAYGTKLGTENDTRLFGGRVASVTFTPLHGNPPRRGSLYHRVVFEFPTATDFTASIWAQTEGDADQEVQLYLIALMNNGEVTDPFEEQVFTIPGGGRWVRLALVLRTPAEGRITELQFAVLSPSADGSTRTLLDGAVVAQGPFAPGFGRIEDVDPARLRGGELPHFDDSPIIGVGPGNEVATSGFDNEYVLFLDRYGVVGTLAYLALFASAFAVVLRAWRREDSLVNVVTLAMLTFTVALAVFNIAAGSYYHFQIMAIYWLLVGLLAASREPGLAAATEPPGPVPALAAGGARAEPPPLRGDRD